MPLFKDENGVYKFTKVFKRQANLVHGFSSRSFGDVKTYQSHGSPAQNLNRFLANLGVSPGRLVKTRQEQAGEIAEVGLPNRGEVVGPADGLITPSHNLLLVIFAADCLPVLLFDPVKGIIGLSHAGWRGSAKGISRKMIESFRRLGSNPRDILVGLGPAICVNHYPVGKEGIVQETFAQEGNQTAVFVDDKLDLEKTNTRQLVESGVLEKNIEVSGVCTFEDPNFYSFRKEKNNLSGEIAAVIGRSVCS